MTQDSVLEASPPDSLVGWKPRGSQAWGPGSHLELKALVFPETWKLDSKSKKMEEFPGPRGP